MHPAWLVAVTILVLGSVVATFALVKVEEAIVALRVQVTALADVRFSVDEVRRARRAATSARDDIGHRG